MSDGFMTVVDDDDYERPAPTLRAQKVAERDRRSETPRTREVIAMLNSLPCTYAFKTSGDHRAEGGHPDVMACCRGRMVAIEMKRPGKRPDGRQFQRLIDWQKAGALVGWAETVEHAREILAHLNDSVPWINPLTEPGDPAVHGSGR
jgi:Holliday junction resolvase